MAAAGLCPRLGQKAGKGGQLMFKGKLRGRVKHIPPEEGPFCSRWKLASTRCGTNELFSRGRAVGPSFAGDLNASSRTCICTYACQEDFWQAFTGN